MRSAEAERTISRIPPHLGEPLSDAVQHAAPAEVISRNLPTNANVEGWGFTYTMGRGVPRFGPFSHRLVLADATTVGADRTG